MTASHPSSASRQRDGHRQLTLFLGDVVAVGSLEPRGELLTATYFRTNMPASGARSTSQTQEAQEFGRHGTGINPLFGTEVAMRAMLGGFLSPSHSPAMRVGFANPDGQRTTLMRAATDSSPPTW